jgi:hypothetical protein
MGEPATRAAERRSIPLALQTVHHEPGVLEIVSHDLPYTVRLLGQPADIIFEEMLKLWRLDWKAAQSMAMGLAVGARWTSSGGKAEVIRHQERIGPIEAEPSPGTRGGHGGAPGVSQ